MIIRQENDNEKGAITRDIKTKLTPDGLSPTCLYGLLKSHKAFAYPFPNYRAVISQNGFATNAIGKHLLDCISSITKNEYTLKNYFQCVFITDK